MNCTPDQDVPPLVPATIAGWTQKGRAEALGRRGPLNTVVGVSDEAVYSAVATPVKPPDYDAKRETWRFVGKDATVVLNRDGLVVTAWPRTRVGWRHDPPLQGIGGDL